MSLYSLEQSQDEGVEFFERRDFRFVRHVINEAHELLERARDLTRVRVRLRVRRPFHHRPRRNRRRRRVVVVVFRWQARAKTVNDDVVDDGTQIDQDEFADVGA